MSTLHAENSVTRSGAALAVLLRQTQWMLDEAARQVSAGQFTPAKANELAGILESLASHMRQTYGPTVIDGS